MTSETSPDSTPQATPCSPSAASVSSIVATDGPAASFGSEWQRYDRMMVGFEESLIEAAALMPGERVIDVGCGAGTTSLHAARAVGPRGRVLGIDLRSDVLAIARERAARAGLSQLSFVRADASSHDFAQSDVVLSRFGSLHFRNLESAYAHLRGALVPRGRLAFVCAREAARNLWASVPLRVLLALAGRVPDQIGKASGPFVLANPRLVRSVLDGAGFSDIELISLGQSVELGADVDDALEFFFAADGHKYGPLLEAIGYERAIDALREALAPYEGPAGVFMPASAWLVLARA